MILMGIKIRINCGESDSDDNDNEMLMLMLMMVMMVMVMMMKYGWNARYAPHCSSPTYSAQLRIVRLQLHLRFNTLLLKTLLCFFSSELWTYSEQHFNTALLKTLLYHVSFQNSGPIQSSQLYIVRLQLHSALLKSNCTIKYFCEPWILKSYRLKGYLIVVTHHASLIFVAVHTILIFI